MTIYDKAKIKCRTFIESINILFNMGKDLETEVGGKQATLVSGTNIKTINGGSVLGEGDLVVVGDAPAIESGDAGKALVVNSVETGAEWSKNIIVNDVPVSNESAVNKTYVDGKRTVIAASSISDLFDIVDTLHIGDLISIVYVNDTTKSFTIGNDVVEYTSVSGDNLTYVFGDIGVCQISGATKLHSGLRINTTAKTIQVNYYDSNLDVNSITIEDTDTFSYFIVNVIKYN